MGTMSQSLPEAPSIRQRKSIRRSDLRAALLSKIGPPPNKGRIAEGTCEWIKGDKQFRNWLTSQGQHLLWISGGPGKGKTFLSTYIVHELTKKREGALILKFFCNSRDGRRNTAQVVLLSFLHQLLEDRHDDKSLHEEVQARFQDPHTDLSANIPREDLWEIFEKGAGRPKGKFQRQIYLVLDGLDECEFESREHLTEKLRATCSAQGATLNFKTIITTRPSTVDAGTDLKINLDDREHQRQTLDDIRTFIRSEAKDRIQEGEAFESFVNVLATRANGTFLWVALAMRMLKDDGAALEAVVDGRDADILDTLLPTGLHSIYNRMLLEALQGKRRRGDGFRPEDAARLIHCVCVAFEPLTQTELAAATGICPTAVSAHLHNCRYMLSELDDGTSDTKTRRLQLVHMSLKEYLQHTQFVMLPAPIGRALWPGLAFTLTSIRRRGFQFDFLDHILFAAFLIHARNLFLRHQAAVALAILIYFAVLRGRRQSLLLLWLLKLSDLFLEHCIFAIFAIHEGKVHTALFMRCLALMQAYLKKDMCNLSHPGALASEVVKRKLESSFPPGLRYACIYWATHFQEGEMTLKDGKQLSMDISGFFEDHFLHWIESLALLGKLSDGVISIRKLLQVVQESAASPQLARFLEDAEKFVRSHGSIIGRTPLQSYGSALVFSPKISEVRNMQWKERLSFIREVAGIKNHWGAHWQTLEGHSGPVSAVAFLQDGKTLASASVDDTVRLWDTGTGAHRQTLKGHSGPVGAVALSPDGRMLASASSDKTVRLWDAGTGAYRQTLNGHSGPVHAVAFSPAGKTLASASDDRTVRFWDAGTGVHRQTLNGHRGPICAIVFSRDGKTLASASYDGTVQLWDASTGAHRQSLEGHSGSIRAMALSRDDKTLASAADDSTVRLWDASTGALRQTLKRHRETVNAVAFSPDGKTLASASHDGTVRLWDAGTGAHRQKLKGHIGIVWAVAFSPDGKLLASAASNGTVRLWDASTGAHRQMFKGHSDSVWAVAFSPDSKTLASASVDETVRLWDAGAGAHRQTLEGHSGSIRAVVLSPDGKMLASASVDGTVRLWDAGTGAHRQTLEGHRGAASTVAFSRDGKTLVSSDDRTVRLWDAGTGAHQQTLEGHREFVSAVSFSPSDKTLASASYDKTVQLWDAGTGTHRQTLKGHSDSVTAVVFSPDSKTLASASEDRTVRLWDAGTGTYQQTLKGHSDSVIAVVFSPDSKTLASASDDGTVRLWDAGTGTHRQTLKGHSYSVTAVVFSPDSKTLASASVDGTVRLWDADLGAHRQTLDINQIPTSLTFSEDGQYLKTDYGSLRLSSASTPGQYPDKSVSDHALYVDKEWITVDGKNLLWLPKDYRPTCACQHGSTLVLGHESGGLTFLHFEFS
ncbi:WD40-repeat-containing domain protein [Chaetomium strumarium]|uniref:Mitochondrial division protein 1 n=1 Tax=Chaetomium strumarium TaxID=1170767 RepID=A0AAJ0GU83_9PEZI|nr:WD40-repeat-containing domain protein [Chaetomium strumarium]